MREFKTFNFNKNWMQITIMIPFLCIIPFAALSDKLCNRPNSILSICLNLSQDDLNFIYVIITILFFLLFIYSFLRIFNVDFSSSFLKNSSPLVLKMFEIFISIFSGIKNSSLSLILFNPAGVPCIVIENPSSFER